MWIVMDIGCIECGEPSDLVGTFTTEERASAVCKQLNNSSATRQGGQHDFEVFALGAPNVIDAEYHQWLEAVEATPRSGSASSPEGI
jgi:hypothetical protein